MNVKGQQVEKWVRKAEEDRLAVISLFKLEIKPSSVICFHAQQCAEKYIKALLIHKKTQFGRTHDLLELVKNLPESIGIADDLMRAIRLLNSFSVLPRYPDWEPTESDVSSAVEAMEVVRNFARSLLGIDSAFGVAGN